MWNTVFHSCPLHVSVRPQVFCAMSLCVPSEWCVNTCSFFFFFFVHIGIGRPGREGGIRTSAVDDLIAAGRGIAQAGVALGEDGWEGRDEEGG